MIRSIPGDFLSVWRDGVRIWWLAPVIPLLVVVPEAIQHIAEIRIGMFNDIATARAVSEDPRRMVWGYLKIAGLVLAILAAIRFWGARDEGRRWYDPRGIAWRPVGLGLAGMTLAALPGMALEPLIGQTRAGWIDMALTIATLPLFALLAAGLSGDRAMTLKRGFTKGWLPALRILLFIAATWAPLAWLHAMNHRWAMGAPDPQVWALMAFDSVVVGFMAVLAGTAIHHGCVPPPREERAEGALPAVG